MTEKDPFKRLSLVRELKKLPREDDSEDLFNTVLDEADRKAESRKHAKNIKRGLGRRSRSH